MAQAYNPESPEFDLQFLLGDHLSTTRGLTDASGTYNGLTYSPFGEVLAGNGSLTNYAFTGQWKDATSGLQHHRARWLDTGIGRWNSTDPVFDFWGNFGNRYLYSPSRAILSADPSGKSFGTLVETVFVRLILGFIVSVNVAGAMGLIGGVIGGIDSYLGGGDFADGFGAGFKAGFIIGFLTGWALLSATAGLAIGATLGIVGVALGLVGTVESLVEGRYAQALFRLITAILCAVLMAKTIFKPQLETASAVEAELTIPVSVTRPANPSQVKVNPPPEIAVAVESDATASLIRIRQSVGGLRELFDRAIELSQGTDAATGAPMRIREGLGAARAEKAFNTRLSQSIGDGDIDYVAQNYLGKISLKGPLMQNDGRPIPVSVRPQAVQGLIDASVEAIKTTDGIDSVVVDLFGFTPEESAAAIDALNSIPKTQVKNPYFVITDESTVY